MSSEVPVPRTAVPLGLTDPVERARAELKATLAAIEERTNVPKRAGIALDARTRQFRRFAARNPAGAVVLAVSAAVAVGVVVWGAVRVYTR